MNFIVCLKVDHVVYIIKPSFSEFFWRKTRRLIKRDVGFRIS